MIGCSFKPPYRSSLDSREGLCGKVASFRVWWVDNFFKIRSTTAAFRVLFLTRQNDAFNGYGLLKWVGLSYALGFDFFSLFLTLALRSSLMFVVLKPMKIVVCWMGTMFSFTPSRDFFCTRFLWWCTVFVYSDRFMALVPSCFASFYPKSALKTSY